ncbi:MAG: hypothetical protein ABJE47_09200 [bacterium]
MLFLHLAPLVFAAGVAFAADRGTLRAARGTIDDRVRQLDDLSRVHPLVISGLILSFLSGVGMFLSDVETFMASTFFWVKLSCVALLLINGLMMTRTEKALAGSGTDTTLWARLRMLSILSAILWLTTTLAGVVLKEFA